MFRNLFSLFFVSSILTQTFAQQFGAIKRELVEQVGVYEVVGDFQGIKISDIVGISHQGKKLGEATVVKISTSSILVSLKGVFSVSINDRVEFARTSTPVSSSSNDDFMEIGTEGNGALSFTFFLYNTIKKIDDDTFRVRIKVRSKSTVYAGDPALNSTYFLWLSICRDGTFDEANEVVSNAYIKDTGEPQIGPWKGRRRIPRATWQATLYKIVFPDERT